MTSDRLRVLAWQVPILALMLDPFFVSRPSAIAERFSAAALAPGEPALRVSAPSRR
jgi:hypothetical protein